MAGAFRKKLRLIFYLNVMQIRKATIADVPAIVAMLADDELGSQREDFCEPLPQAYVVAFQSIDRDPNQELMVVMGEGKEVVGTMQLSFIQYLTYQGGVRAQIEAVRIRKDARGKGVGKEMIGWAIQRAKEKHAHVLQLTTDKRRPAAIEFYRSIGFEQSHDGMKMHFRYEQTS
jgi:ribosomal protein S18 acetylase RimI-like enzyme